MPEDCVAVSLLLRKQRDTFSISRNWANIRPTYNFHLMKVLSSAGIQWGQHQPEARHLQLAEMQHGSQQAAALQDCMLDAQSLRLQGWITSAPNKQLHQKVSSEGETEISAFQYWNSRVSWEQMFWGGCLLTALSVSIFQVYVSFDRVVSTESEMTQTWSLLHLWPRLSIPSRFRGHTAHV